MGGDVLLYFKEEENKIEITTTIQTPNNPRCEKREERKRKLDGGDWITSAPVMTDLFFVCFIIIITLVTVKPDDGCYHHPARSAADEKGRREERTVTRDHPTWCDVSTHSASSFFFFFCSM